MLSLVSIKLLLLLVILLAGWFGGLVPLLRASRDGSGRFQSWGNAFGAGIFLGIGLIHMLGEADRAWRGLGWDYPMAFVLAAAAFAGILLFEHVLLPDPAHDIVHSHSGDSMTERGMEAVTSSVYPYMLVVALSAHSVVAGIALGAQDGFTNVFVLFIAIMAHKSTAGFALGISLVRNEIPSSRAHGVIGVFALMTPAGILAGMAVSSLLQSAGERYFDASLLALTAGTFIYIASLDIIQDEFLPPGSRFVKWLWAAIGLALMALLAIYL